MQCTYVSGTTTPLICLMWGENGTIFCRNNANWRALGTIPSLPDTFAVMMTQTGAKSFNISIYDLNTRTLIVSSPVITTYLGDSGYPADILFGAWTQGRITGSFQVGKLWTSWTCSQIAGYGYKITGTGHTTGNSSGTWSTTLFTHAQWWIPTVQGLHFTLAGVLNTYGNGTYKIQYCSWDFAGNNETLLSRIVYIDTIEPTTSISFTPAYESGGKYWINSSTLITIAGVDNPGGSGAPYTFYNWTGPTNHGWALSSAPFTLTTATINGTYIINYYSIDNVGNVAAFTQWTPVFVDTQVPTTNISYDPSFTAGQKTWVRTDTLYKFTANDGNGSGVNETWAKVNGTDNISWTHITGPFTLVGIINGTYTISWCSWDNVGNNESLQSKLLFVDAIAPTTTIIQPTYLYTKTVPYTKNFTSGSATFALNATDNPGGSGIKYTSYRITVNGVAGPVYNYSTPFTLGSSANGTYTITWWSVDNTGIAETMHSLTVYIDTVFPVTTIIQPSYIYNSGSKNFTTGGATFFLSPVDDGGSGVALTQYRVNGGTWVSGMSFSINSYWGMTITNGTYTIEWNSTDNLGHVEGTHHLTVYIDTTPPTTTIVEPTYLYNSGSKKFTTGIVMFALNAQDNVGGSRVLTTSYGITVNGVAGTWTSYTGPFTLGSSVNGTYSIAWYSTDHVGNVEATHGLTVYIDKIAPNTTISFKNASAPDHVNSSTTFALTAQDNAGGSGVASIQYQYTGSNGSWISYNTPFTLENKQNGTVMIMYRAIDNVGNVEMTGNVTVYLIVLPGPTPQPSFWDTYGMYIIIAAIGVACIAIIGGVAASKKKKMARAKASPDKTLASKKKTAEAYQPLQAATPATAIVPPKAPPVQAAIPAPIGDFNLYCPACEQWYPRPSGTAISGSELCPACSRPLSFVPKCDACGNGMVKPVSEFNAFVNSDRACDRCGKAMRIQ